MVDFKPFCTPQNSEIVVNSNERSFEEICRWAQCLVDFLVSIICCSDFVAAKPLWIWMCNKYIHDFVWWAIEPIETIQKGHFLHALSLNEKQCDHYNLALFSIWGVLFFKQGLFYEHCVLHNTSTQTRTTHAHTHTQQQNMTELYRLTQAKYEMEWKK